LDTLTKIRSALEKAGAEFIAENGGGAAKEKAKAGEIKLGLAKSLVGGAWTSITRDYRWSELKKI
jgi:hypothetical protein